MNLLSSIKLNQKIEKIVGEEVKTLAYKLEQ